MLEALVGCRSLIVIELEHLVDQVDAVLGSPGNYRTQRCRCHFWEVDASHAGKLIAFLPVRRWCPERRANFHKLVSFRVPWENRSLQEHLSNDAAHSPNVDGRVVAGGANQQFRSSVPAGTDVVCQRRSRSDFTSKAKVGQFDILCVVDQEILWLHVSMEKSILVAASDAL